MVAMVGEVEKSSTFIALVTQNGPEMLWDGHHGGKGGEILNFYCPDRPEWPHGADLCAGKLRQEGGTHTPEKS